MPRATIGNGTRFLDEALLLLLTLRLEPVPV